MKTSKRSIPMTKGLKAMSTSRTVQKYLFALAFVCASLTSAKAVEKQWGNAGSTSWTTAGNWSPPGIPTTSDWINFSGADANPGTGMQINFGTTNPFAIQTIRWNRTTNNNVGSNATTAGNLRLDGPSGGNPFLNLLQVDNTGNFAVQPFQGGSGVLTLQLNQSGTFNTSNTGGLVIASNITETGGARSLITSGTSASATGNVGSGSFGTRDGSYAGAIVFTGTGSYTGTTTLSSGYLNLGNINAVQTSSGVTVSSGGQLQLGVPAGGTYVVGASTLALNGSGPTAAANPGALLIGNNVTAATTHTINNTISLATDSTINARGATNILVLGGNISGSGGFIKQGGGRIDIGGAGSFAGNTVINNGTLRLITGNDRLPTGTTVSLGQVGNNNLGTLDINGRNQQIAGLNSTTGTNASASNNTVTSATTATLTLGGSGTYSYGDGTNANSGVITGTISLVKTGSGTQLLGDANTYTGGTTVNGGTLGGTGTIGGPAVFNSSTVHSPGNSPGQQTVNGNYTLNSGSRLQIEINGTTAGTQYDQVVVTGNVTLNNPNLGLSLGFAPTVGNTFTIINNTGPNPVSGTFNGLSEGQTFNLPNTGSGGGTFTFQISYVGGTGNDVVLTNTAFAANSTAVSLASFEAAHYANGTWLQWRTGLETDNLGFNVYREQNGQRVKLNSALIGGASLMPSTTLAAQGYYAWPVGTGATGQYWLEDVDIEGHKTWHGPVSVKNKAGNAKLQRSLLLGEAPPPAQVEGKTSRAVALVSATKIMPRDLTNLPTGNLAQQWQLAAQPAIKISVQGSGWVRVRQEQLVAAGLNPGTAPGVLQLFAEGKAIPITVSSPNGSSFGKSDYIEFYAQGLDTTTTDKRIYWMPSSPSGSGLRVPVVTAAAPGATAVSSFTCTAQVKPRSIYYSSLRNGSASNFFGPVIGSEAATQVVDAPELAIAAKTPAALDIGVQGVTTGAHAIEVQCNGVVVGTVSFSGNSYKVVRLSVPVNALRSGSNTFTLTAQGASDVSLLESLTLRYTRTYRAINNNLVFTAPGGLTVRVQGFSTNSIQLLDITDPARVQSLMPRFESVSGGYNLALTVPGSSPRTLMALPIGQFQTPNLVEANRASNWHETSHQADLVIIAHRSLLSSLNPLLSLRRRQGMVVEFLDVADVFDEYGYGAHDPLALNRFLSEARRWAKVPRYVMLAGDSSYDPRNYLGQGAVDLVPTQLVDTASMETASDDALADFNNDGIADMAVGRLPARTASEATTMVNKIVGYAGLLANPTSPSAPQGALLINDNTRGFNFKAASDEIGSLLPSTLVRQSISRNDGDVATVHNSVLRAINQGPLVTSFFGHGSTDIWTGGELLSNSDTASLSNGSRLSLFLPMTCLNGYFHSPSLDSLGESLFKAPNGGAIAVWASSGITDPAAQFAMDKSLVKTLFTGSKPVLLGDAIRIAKAATSDKDVRRTWILIGDPTTQLLPAPPKAAQKTAAQKAAEDQALQMLSSVSNLPLSFPLPIPGSTAKPSAQDGEPSS